VVGLLGTVEVRFCQPDSSRQLNVRPCLRFTESRLHASQVLFDRNYEDAYTDPGSPAKRRTPQGTYVLAQLADETDSGRRLLLMQARSPDKHLWIQLACRGSAAACTLE